MTDQIVRTNPPGLPRPRVPFTQTVAHRGIGLVFISGLAPLDPNRRTVGDDIYEQGRAVYRNLGLALAAHGCSFHDLLKITIYLRDPSDIDAFNVVPAEFYPSDVYPAATLVAGIRLVDPAWRVEIEAIAAMPPSG